MSQSENRLADEIAKSLRKKHNELGSAIDILGEAIDEINRELERRKSRSSRKASRKGA